MAEEHSHLDLGPYVLGGLSASEREEYERHLAICGRCADELPSVRRVAAALGDAIAPIAPASALKQRVLAAVADGEEPPALVPAAPRRRRPSVRALAGGVAVAAAVAVAAVVLRGGNGSGVPRAPDGDAGSRRLRPGVRRGPEDGNRADRDVLERLAPDPPERGVLRGLVRGARRPARPSEPDSAGTFHPDEDGRSFVRFAAAVDPALYPVVTVTAEPSDGDPRATGPEVLRTGP